MPAGGFATMDVTSQGMESLGSAMTQSAYARATNTQAASAELDLALRKKLMQDMPKLMQQGQPGGGQGLSQDPTSTLMRTGEWYTNHGDPITGGKIMEQASLIGQHQSSVLLNGMRANTLQANQQQQQSEERAAMLGNVMDESSWRTYLQMTGHPEAVGKVQYPGPEGIKFMQEAALKLKDQLAAKARDKTLVLTEKYRNTEIQLAKTRQAYIKKQIDRQAQGKAGKDPRLPPTEVFKDAQSLVQDKHGAWTNEKRDALAWAVADDANKAMRDNPALQMTEALNTAYAKHEQDANMLNSGADKGMPPLPPGFQLGLPEGVDITNLPDDDAAMQDAMTGDTGDQQ